MLQWFPRQKRIIRPAGSCQTLECSNCHGLEFRNFVEPLPNGGAVLREIACLNPKCAKVCAVENGRIGGKTAEKEAYPSIEKIINS